MGKAVTDPRYVGVNMPWNKARRIAGLPWSPRQLREEQALFVARQSPPVAVQENMENING